MNDWMWQQSAEQAHTAMAAADRLAQGLTSGWRPAAIQVPVHLPAGEGCFAQEDTQVLQYLEGDGTYLHTTSFGFGFVGLAMTMGSAIGNHARKQRAMQEAAARYRPVEAGRMYLTNHRFAVQGRQQWIDIWFEDIRMSTCDATCVYLTLGSSSPVALRVWPAPYHFTLYRWLAHGQIVHPQPPPAIGPGGWGG
ncbi:hypothetical protein [Streptomyces sp. NRRL B-3229]|uniref:hypothetical protein n=1 Tax=Streptomyces sp. NRRL B-3229 TaxID=1463836 RepID=UPI0004BE844D|nr:hypothetical protein [Streptomyces sp. NRRL B-3229]